jgi:hypothetical protein
MGASIRITINGIYAVTVHPLRKFLSADFADYTDKALKTCVICEICG